MEQFKYIGDSVILRKIPFHPAFSLRCWCKVERRQILNFSNCLFYLGSRNLCFCLLRHFTCCSCTCMLKLTFIVRSKNCAADRSENWVENRSENRSENCSESCSENCSENRSGNWSRNWSGNRSENRSGRSKNWSENWSEIVPKHEDQSKIHKTI